MGKDPIKTLLPELTRQGYEVRNRTKGYFIVPPNTEHALIAVHKTPSDARAFKNLIARLRRTGFDWK